MEKLYGFHCTGDSSMALPSPPTTDDHTINPLNWTPVSGPNQLASSSSSNIAVATSPAVAEAEVSLEFQEQEQNHLSETLAAKIASHPLYPKLLDAYIDLHKVGAPPEMVELLKEIGDESSGFCQEPTCLSADPELDNFMEMYYDLLVKFKSDLSKPFDEATAFLNDMEKQLNYLCTADNIPDIESTISSGEDFSKEDKDANACKRVYEDRELKDKLLRRYSGYISGLKHEFSKKKKQEKLPKEATQILLAWWNIHFKWPYPTEADKVALAEWTGLDQKQINNWFINQRKRHWKPTEEMQAAVLEGLYGPFYTSD
ncbi:hypothetical protein L6164_011050 [Bauhinia variegata]|uniref:Uncharacterized protein n=1 Tax=Bauhinia variegata TaxID=167791 RepID=A0ACB9P4H4_BAUVA|nr:hypothetical protein L6164_011050 [Bauhinia variegata]